MFLDVTETIFRALLVSYCVIVMVATSQEMVREKTLRCQGNVREFYSGSGKIGILKKSQEKLKL